MGWLSTEARCPEGWVEASRTLVKGRQPLAQTVGHGAGRKKRHWIQASDFPQGLLADLAKGEPRHGAPGGPSFQASGCAGGTVPVAWSRDVGPGFLGKREASGMKSKARSVG